MWRLLAIDPMIFLATFVALIYALTVHEFAHAYVALTQGDTTAKDQGRLTLNPLAHLDHLGVMMLVFVGFGWGRPVPVDPRNFKNGIKSDNLVSVAGVIVNVISCLLFMFLFKILFSDLNPIALYFGDYQNINLLAYFLSSLVVTNLIIAVFNLLPIFPLDGSHLFLNHLPVSWDKPRVLLIKNGPTVLLVLLLIDNFTQVNVFGYFFSFFINGLNIFYHLL